MASRMEQEGCARRGQDFRAAPLKAHARALRAVLLCPYQCVRLVATPSTFRSEDVRRALSAQLRRFGLECSCIGPAIIVGSPNAS